MTRQQRRIDDEPDYWSSERRRGGPSVGTLFLAAALGVGIGLLAAPETGEKTRKRLRKRLTTLGDDFNEGLGEVQDLSGRARKGVRDRLSRLRKRGEDMLEDFEEPDEDEEESEDSSAFGTILAVAAGVAATYFLSSERAGPARTRVRETAATVRREAEDRWERFQNRHGSNGHTRSDSGETRGEARPSDETPKGS